MKLAPQITSRDIELTDAIKAEILKRIEKLDKFYDQIMRCRVLVEAPHRHKSEGIFYNVNIYLTIPGNELVIKREPNEDLYVAIRDSFDAARRKLEDYARLQRREVKKHELQPHGKISKLFLERGYGFITTYDGREIYFHRNSVVNKDFDRLKIGMDVRFSEEEGEKGPQASTVTIMGK